MSSLLNQETIVQDVHDPVNHALNVNATVVGGDIEIGAVEIKNGTDDTRATVTGANALKVDGSAVTQPVSAASLPLPTGAATSAAQTTGNASLSSIDTKLPSNLTVNNTRLSVVQPSNWSVVHNPAAATQATVTRAAGAGSVVHVCNAITATISTNGTAQTPIHVYLRDGASGVGTILWSAVLAAPSAGVAGVSTSGLHIVGSAATAMTLEFEGAGVAASVQSVTLGGFDA